MWIICNETTYYYIAVPQKSEYCVFFEIIVFLYRISWRIGKYTSLNNGLIILQLTYNQQLINYLITCFELCGYV